MGRQRYYTTVTTVPGRHSNHAGCDFRDTVVRVMDGLQLSRCQCWHSHGKQEYGHCCGVSSPRGQLLRVLLVSSDLCPTSQTVNLVVTAACQDHSESKVDESDCRDSHGKFNVDAVQVASVRGPYQ
jgi:hypothetical protein